LLQQINKTFIDETLYLNFEDPRLAGFDISDFNRLHEIVTAKGINTLFFDEIQNVEKWENSVRFRLDEGYRVFITGSNASMVSKELGTKLTGRHITKELFPFSYEEYLAFAGEKANAESTNKYLQSGGFPERLKTGMPEVMMNVFNDIIFRNILRYNVKNTSALQQLAVWLISNTGKRISGNSLRKIFSIRSSSSIMEYLSHFGDAYLFFFVPRFSFSHKVQIVNLKKVYAIDNGMIEANSISFSNDNGRLLENMVYMQLRRKTKEIYYFAEKKECDFIVYKGGKLSGLYQVCWQLDQENLDWEIAGLREALEFFNCNSGVIITHDQSDVFTKDSKTITAIPFHKWALTGS
jgi:predicted AAA+ superfamily ATPase